MLFGNSRSTFEGFIPHGRSSDGGISVKPRKVLQVVVYWVTAYDAVLPIV